MIAQSPASGNHTPVLLNAVVSSLVTSKTGIYVDGTFGKGGHTQALANALDEGATLVGIDQDASLLETFDQSGIAQSLHLVHANFENLDQALRAMGIQQVNGILYDLGLNSATLEDAERGFSFDRNGPLDMRFDQSQPLTAARVLNDYSEKALGKILFEYGEEKAARKMARAIVLRRESTSFKTTADLRAIVAELTPYKYLVKALSRVFQAIRIEVNHEFEALKTGLEKAVDLLVPGGRLAVISYHSLEDRIVKRYFQSQSLQPAPPEIQPYQNTVPGRIDIITRKPVVPDEEEVAQNPRARSAKLRVVERRS
ncbi:MAG: 16S rRNA (cytosine(1402)-N(4))-methyltransferase RsmH [Lentisphaeria bacterium]|nr:16S rRNA (cytosine(1402)-N(4))-methyltransferase RsmH [Candidatus Neomarinimicrobiota bacterium]MCF7842884.1 16S rRNA (cytosine(1402)-N(4))-methyltransferase RsmH [Lentisphaeria bacterium]